MQQQGYLSFALFLSTSHILGECSHCSRRHLYSGQQCQWRALAYMKLSPTRCRVLSCRTSLPSAGQLPTCTLHCNAATWCLLCTLCCSIVQPTQKMRIANAEEACRYWLCYLSPAAPCSTGRSSRNLVCLYGLVACSPFLCSW